MSRIESIVVELTPEAASYVQRAVEAGEFASTSEAIGEALRDWQERRELFGYTVEELRALAQEGIDSGPSVDGEEAFAKLDAELSELANRRPTA